MEKLQKVWKRTLELVQPELTSPSYDTWVHPLVPVKIDKGKKVLYLSSNNALARSILEQRYSSIIEQKLEVVCGEPLRISVISEDDAEFSRPDDEEASFDGGAFFNPRYCFDTFVIGANNKFAHAAALAVAEAPTKAYNPLFIYGGAGLGKTHLMHSIGQFIKTDIPSMKVLYVSSETFTNELIKSINERSNAQFRLKYRNIDVLLIDDIQFIEKKESTQEEIFHTINTLYEANKQIIISSDRPPKDLSTLNERLRSRFEMGLVADIQAPDYETKVAILRNKAELEGLFLDDDMLDVINIIAENIHSNIRELEGAFNRVVAHGNLLRLEINRDLVKVVLKEVFSAKGNQPAPEAIKKHVCKRFNIKLSDIESAKRTRNFSYPRQIAMYLCRSMTDLSLPKIGEFFGNRDHTTVLHAVDKIEDERASNTSLADILSSLESDIRNN
jgi:chromosomal replication initiator protein